jgi:hypothetical protein
MYKALLELALCIDQYLIQLPTPGTQTVTAPIMISPMKFTLAALLIYGALSAKLEGESTLNNQLDPPLDNDATLPNVTVPSSDILLQEWDEFRKKYSTTNYFSPPEAHHEQGDEGDYCVIEQDSSPRWVKIIRALFPNWGVQSISIKEYKQSFDKMKEFGKVPQKDAWDKINFKGFSKDSNEFRQKANHVFAYVNQRLDSPAIHVLDIAAYFAAEFPFPVAGPACLRFFKTVILKFKKKSFLYFVDAILKYDEKVKIKIFEYPPGIAYIHTDIENVLLRKIASLDSFNILIDILLQCKVPAWNWMNCLFFAIHHYTVNFFKESSKASSSGETRTESDVILALEGCDLNEFSKCLSLAVNNIDIAWLK